ncbi:MAG TPA: HisA/HisF-related TIM barrel protein, partial [Candidatus Micrarchaeota archaeon]|nr:HisA/HisF-related TIM barrel protein [Candidatus Micrarchaeota archaeon]
MEIIPAIDIMDGKPVRLKKGLEASAKTYQKSPAGIAKELYSLGYKRIHVVDLDAAFGTRPNTATISDICN